jgi:hypothetical protein
MLRNTLNALRALHDHYVNAYTFLNYAETAEHHAEETRYRRRALKWKTKGLVAHDRELIKEYK